MGSHGTDLPIKSILFNPGARGAYVAAKQFCDLLAKCSRKAKGSPTDCPATNGSRLYGLQDVITARHGRST